MSNNKNVLLDKQHGYDTGDHPSNGGTWMVVLLLILFLVFIMFGGGLFGGYDGTMAP